MKNFCIMQNLFISFLRHLIASQENTCLLNDLYSYNFFNDLESYIPIPTDSFHEELQCTNCNQTSSTTDKNYSVSLCSDKYYFNDKIYSDAFRVCFCNYTPVKDSIFSENIAEFANSASNTSYPAQNHICNTLPIESYDYSLSLNHTELSSNQKNVSLQNSTIPNNCNISSIQSFSDSNKTYSSSVINHSEIRKRRLDNKISQQIKPKKRRNASDSSDEASSLSQDAASVISEVENISEENICTVETKSSFTEQARKTLTSLFSEIEDLNTESISFESMYSKKIYNYIFYYGWNKYINDHIENYNSIIINSVKEFKDVLDVAESLLFYEKYFPGYVSQYEIICLYEIMEGILLEIKNEENFGLFYELIKFVAYYESRLSEYIESNHCLHVYFILSIISNQLKNISFEILKGIKISKCNKNIKCTSFNDEIKEEYLKIFFIQRLFSKLLLGMKNGKLRTQFYIIFIILDFSSETHHKHHYLNQKSYFRFYLLVLASFILEYKFNSNIIVLNTFLKLSLNILNLKMNSQQLFFNETHFMMKTFFLGISTVKLNLEIIDKIKVFANKSSYISENLAYLREKYLNLNTDLSVSYKHLTLNDIFLSEICLSSYLSRQYEDLLFDNKIISIGWKRLYKNKIKSPEYTLDVKN
ncbi:hypothetical protein CWI37_0066p0040 [Hamiltosporidium tvaerminnensis]|uniref:Uncharacterized protein n=1 Tax=Hamiltosporidium tvaerminnensis TaxID=1176355 RepID=A0A4Q9LAY0_9MICR|nr:hypothetical protein CWI37_0066p0040 [Hamiltosporidium tvaerminnensis]